MSSAQKIPRKLAPPDGRPGRRHNAQSAAQLQSAVAVLAGARIATAAAPVAQPQFSGWRPWDRSFQFSFFELLQTSKSPYSFRTMVQSQASQSFTIGKLATAGGVGVETIRYYQRRGLLQTPARDDGIRRYGSADVRRLHFINQAQAAGSRSRRSRSCSTWTPARTASAPANGQGERQGAGRTDRAS